MGHFWGSPRTLAISGLSQVVSKCTLNFEPWSTKLGGTVGVIKKMAKNDNGLDPGRNYRETAGFTFGQSCFWPKFLFIQSKKSLESANRLISNWEKGTFLFAQHFPVVARTWCPLRSESFSTRFSAQKSVFCHMTLKRPFCGPRRNHCGDTVCQ